MVIVFGALVPLFALQKANSPPLPSVTRDEPDVTTRQTISLYYSKVIIYRQIMMNTCMAYSLMMPL